MIFFICPKFFCWSPLYIQNQYTWLIHLITEYICLTGKLYYLSQRWLSARKEKRKMRLFMLLSELPCFCPEVNKFYALFSSIKMMDGIFGTFESQSEIFCSLDFRDVLLNRFSSSCYFLLLCWQFSFGTSLCLWASAFLLLHSADS